MDSVNVRPTVLSAISRSTPARQKLEHIRLETLLDTAFQVDTGAIKCSLGIHEPFVAF